MKCNYLIQIKTNNKNIGATGWHTVSGGVTKSQAVDLMVDFLELVEDKSTVRLISLKDFQAEIKAWNHQQMRLAQEVMA